MLKQTVAGLLPAFLVSTAVLLAQKPKSQKEVDAIVAMQSATDNDSRIKAANELLTKFADTEFKPFALYMITSSYREKNDHTNTIVYGERVVEADPKSAFGGHARVMIASALAATTKEFDFDKEEKLGRAEKLAKESVDILKAAPKFNPGLADDQWEAIRKDYIAEAYTAIGMVNTVRKKWDDAIANFKLGIESSANPDPVVFVRLVSAYNGAGKYDDAIAAADKALAIQGMPAAIANYLKSEKDRAVKGKGAK